MATPTNISISGPSTKKLRCGSRVPRAYEPALDLLAAAPPHSWVKLNVNRYEDAWPSYGFRAPYQGNYPTQEQADTAAPDNPPAVIRAWCSFAWNDDSGDAILIDPGDEVDGLLRLADAKRLSIGLILLTHAHVDHVSGVAGFAHIVPVPGASGPDQVSSTRSMPVCTSLLVPVKVCVPRYCEPCDSCEPSRCSCR